MLNPQNLPLFLFLRFWVESTASREFGETSQPQLTLILGFAQTEATGF